MGRQKYLEIGAGGGASVSDELQSSARAWSSGSTTVLETITAISIIAALYLTAIGGSPLLSSLYHGKDTVMPFSSVTRVELAPSDTLVGGSLRDKSSSVAPFPTGAWWSNLVMGDGDQAIAALPYQFKVDAVRGAETDLWGGGLQVSYGPLRRTSSFEAVIDWFGVDMCLRATEVAVSHAVTRHDPLTVDVTFTLNDPTSSFKAVLARGSPYATIEYWDTTPLIVSQKRFVSLKRWTDTSSLRWPWQPDLPRGMSAFVVRFGNAHDEIMTWLVFFSDVDVVLVANESGTLKTAAPFTGTMRVALVPPTRQGRGQTAGESAERLLVKHAGCVPRASTVVWDIEHDEPGVPVRTISRADVVSLQDGFKHGQGAATIGPSTGHKSKAEYAAYTFNFETTHLGHNEGITPLLMVALPHHVSTLEAASVKLTGELVYDTLKGLAVGVASNRWTLVEPLTSIDWFSPEDLQRPGATKFLAALRSALDADMVPDVSGTNPDGKLIDPKWVDPYGFGKAAAKLARLALVAEELLATEGDANAATHAQHALDGLKEALEPWLAGTNDDAFVYDSTWGGLISTNGAESQEADFGNGNYNDHHLQYGYFIYALAVVARHDKAFVTRPAVEAILRDIANPGKQGLCRTVRETPHSMLAGTSSMANLFPVARHKDFFDGHSWASGLFPMPNGKSQESVSEAVNAYYAVHLLGKALRDDLLSRWGRFLLALELRGAHWYWQTGKDWAVYPANFSRSKMVGVVGSTDAKVWTWFGSNPEYVHGINMMPFTPITEQLMGAPYVSEEFPVIEPRLEHVADQWKGLIELARAVLDPEAAFEAVAPLTANRIDGFDAGNSLTNSLYWIATRPRADMNSP